MNYPDQLEIKPLTKPPVATIRVPGSKSITNRALVLAALQGRAFGSCELLGILNSEDTQVMVSCLTALGFEVECDWVKSWILVTSREREKIIPASNAELFVGNSGTTMRFLTALVSLGHGFYRLDGIPRMRERPIEDLLVSLRNLGVRVESENNNGCPPVIVQANGLRGGSVQIKGDTSSQFLSGLLMAAPLAESDLAIQIEGPLVSAPYIRMTVEMLKQFGYAVDVHRNHCFQIPGKQLCGIRKYQIEPDASAASYFFGAAAITAGKVTVLRSDWRETTARNPQAELELQGDWRFTDVLEQMGCQAKKKEQCSFAHVRSDGWRLDKGPEELPRSDYLAKFGTSVRGAPLRGIDVDMNAISDTVMTLAAVACFAEGPTTIRNVAHIRHKETDRLAALATELRKVGAEVEEYADGLKIMPRPLHGAVIDTYNDHRMAMSMALIGLKVPGIVINNPGCVAKTYPGFFEDLEKLRA